MHGGFEKIPLEGKEREGRRVESLSSRPKWLLGGPWMRDDAVVFMSQRWLWAQVQQLRSPRDGGSPTLGCEPVKMNLSIPWAWPGHGWRLLCWAGQLPEEKACVGLGWGCKEGWWKLTLSRDQKVTQQHPQTPEMRYFWEIRKRKEYIPRYYGQKARCISWASPH